MTAKRTRGYLSSHERLVLKRSTRRKFRNLVWFAHDNTYWLEDSGAGLGDNVMKNIKLLTQKKGKKAAVSIHEKSIMNKPKEKRTEEENHAVFRCIGNMKCFRKYPSHVKQQLADCTYFVYVEPGRDIVRQDDKGTSLFFILEGEVQVTQTRWDSILNEFAVVFSGTMESGAMFGEVSLLHGIKRLATVSAKEHCELLMIKKEDFDIVLKSTVIGEWNIILAMMEKFSYFKSWDDVTKRECCILAKKAVYEHDEVILGKGAGDDRLVHFLVKGKCSVIEHIDVRVTRNTKTSSDVPRYALIDQKGPKENFRQDFQLKFKSPPKSRTQVRNARKSITSSEKAKTSNLRLVTNTLETHFVRVCTFSELSCFSLGENRRHRYHVAVGNVECLLIPRAWLLQRHKHVWLNIVNFLDNEIPSTKKVFQNFVEEQRWIQYKEGLFNELSKNVNTRNTINNVPYSIRMKKDLEYYKTLFQPIN